jgi:hypothetical protein
MPRYHDFSRLDAPLKNIPDRRPRDAEPPRAGAVRRDVPQRPAPVNVGESSADPDWPTYNQLGGANPDPKTGREAKEMAEPGDSPQHDELERLAGAPRSVTPEESLTVGKKYGNSW